MTLLSRGDVVKIVARGAGHAQHGPRFGVVVQADTLLGLSTVLIAPTSRSSRPTSFRAEVTVLGESTQVLVEQMRPFDVSAVGDHVGHLSIEEMWALDTALVRMLGLF